jgi:Xaa-Pro aminopeptidase
MIKSPWELEQMGHAAELSRKTFEYIKNTIRPGLTEIEFAGLYETFARKHGHGGQLRVRDYLTEGFNWHILSGTSGGMVGLIDSPASGEGTSAAFPCGGGHKPIQTNEPVMIDTGIVLNGFHMDETRMFSIGDMPARALKACQVAIEIHDALIEKAKPGISLGELFDFSVSMAESLGYGEQYLGPPGHKVTFIGHCIGHELIEPPIIAQNRQDPLQPGMVFAVEPKLVFQNEFIAGVESIFSITETGTRLISKVPVEIFIC